MCWGSVRVCCDVMSYEEEGGKSSGGDGLDLSCLVVVGAHVVVQVELVVLPVPHHLTQHTHTEGQKACMPCGVCACDCVCIECAICVVVCTCSGSTFSVDMPRISAARISI